MFLLWIGLGLVVIVSIIDGLWYAYLTPTPSAPPLLLQPRWRIGLALILHIGAYALTILRLPFTLLPYLAKISLFIALGARFSPWWQHPVTQIFRWLGDAANFLVTASLLQMLALNFPLWGRSLMDCIIVSEITRLVLEKWQMLVSAVWQQLPHREIAYWLQSAPLQNQFRPYSDFYQLDDAGRLAYVSRLLRRWSMSDSTVAARLRYFEGFRIVESHVDLRTGAVRDVARGTVFVHARWSSDPWLLIGLALRRSPWVFDPRCLPRPFYYRSEANPVVTRFVLEQAHFCLPFSLYQLGHEIKVARYEIFFRLCRWLRWDLEAYVRADGTYEFDPALVWLTAWVTREKTLPTRPLWNDAELVCIAIRDPSIATLSTEQLAMRYTYPRPYVEEVLLSAVRQAASSAADTASGASQ